MPFLTELKITSNINNYKYHAPKELKFFFEIYNISVRKSFYTIFQEAKPKRELLENLIFKDILILPFLKFH